MQKMDRRSREGKCATDRFDSMDLETMVVLAAAVVQAPVANLAVMFEAARRQPAQVRTCYGAILRSHGVSVSEEPAWTA